SEDSDGVDSAFLVSSFSSETFFSSFAIKLGYVFVSRVMWPSGRDEYINEPPPIQFSDGKDSVLF
ncbi:MAG TPA: hypothetical protein VJ911_01615, partial [Cryomorphaceae bacterium]|nr:hypothetical protein [Cryomorphaceae bacterium]